MDNFEYLNQISQSNRPVKPRSTKSHLFRDTPLLKIIIGGVVIFFFLMALGILLSNLNKKPTDLIKQLYVRTSNVQSTLEPYGSSLKSSQLRAINASVSSVLTNASRELSAYITETSGDDKSALIPDEKTAASESALINELNTSLTNAKLNGILDRNWHNQVSLQVSLLLSLTSNLAARNKDPKLASILSSYYSNLSTIDERLSAYESNT